jgi:hypothetical protein
MQATQICIVLISTIIVSAASIVYGAAELSRYRAASMITTYLLGGSITRNITLSNGNKKNTLYIQYKPDPHYGPGVYDELHSRYRLGDSFVNAEEKWIQLQEKGLITYSIVETRIPNYSNSPSYFLRNDKHFPGQSRCPQNFYCQYYDAFLIHLTPKALPFLTC